MALNDILTSLDSVRDSLVTAINNKGGSLSGSATLYQCADAVANIQGGGTSAEYYKCASVDTGGTVLDESTLVASGFGTRYGFEVDGTYTLRSGSGTDRVYVKGSIILSYNTGSSCWEFTAPDFEPDPLALTAASCETPWDATSWITVAGSPLSGATVSRSETTVSGSTWSGYKAVFDSTAGTWSFESDVTEGLAYTSVTPVVGGIYSPDALVTAILYNKVFDNLIAYYKLDGNCRDSVNIHDGIPNNITFVDGKIGRCAHTDGYSQYISLPNEVSVKGRTQVSYSGWCFIESNPNEDFYIITEIANSNGYTRAAFGVNAALLPFAIARTVATGDTGSVQKVTGTSPMSTGTWYFLCAVFDLTNGNITLYVNGVSVGSLNITASSFVDANPYRIRIFEFDAYGSGNIRVDEVGIWSKALSATEVSELYNNGAGKLL